MYKKLNPILLNQARLSIMALLIHEMEADFSLIQRKTTVSAGNLSIQLNKLKKAGYLEITKQFKGNYPQTTCKISKKGMEAVTEFFESMESYKTIQKEIVIGPTV